LINFIFSKSMVVTEIWSEKLYKSMHEGAISLGSILRRTLIYTISISPHPDLQTNSSIDIYFVMKSSISQLDILQQEQILHKSICKYQMVLITINMILILDKDSLLWHKLDSHLHLTSIIIKHPQMIFRKFKTVIEQTLPF
jgi:hypothetical protein